MNKAFRSASSHCIILIAITLVGLAGCENPGSIGSDIGGTKATVAIDTFSVDGVTTRSLNYYSGDYSFFSAGQYEDPLFGNLRAMGLIKPSLPRTSQDTLASDAKMIMRLMFDGTQVYGDSLAGQSFDIYKVKDAWRARSIKLQDNIALYDSNGPIGSFTVGAGDSASVELPSEWVQEYRTYANDNADSLYHFEQYGLALVPSGSNKIIAPNIDSTKFVIQNPGVDTFRVSVNQAAYTLERSNTGSLPQGSVAWHSTQENVLQFDLNLSKIDVHASDIARAELVLYQNVELMQSSLSSEPSSVVRPGETAARLFLVDTAQLPDNITPGNPVAQGSYSTDDEAFHFPLTSQLQSMLSRGVPEGQKFVVKLSNNGIIKSSVIYTDQAPAAKRPKIIITSLKNNSN